MGHVKCSGCGKSVSNEVSGTVIVRAYVECPECAEKSPDLQAENARLREALERIADTGPTSIAAQLSQAHQAGEMQRVARAALKGA